jgi:hypothetical protein
MVILLLINKKHHLSYKRESHGANIGIYITFNLGGLLARSRYWKITPDEMEKFSYNESKLLNWEIKCVREPESEARFIGVFMYRNGTAYDYESVKGITYYHNNIPRNELSSITKFLQGRYNGKEMEKGERVFLKDSKEIYTPGELADLAKNMEQKFNTKAIISLEFEGLTHDELKDAGLPEAKLLPIPGK